MTLTRWSSHACVNGICDVLGQLPFKPQLAQRRAAAMQGDTSFRGRGASSETQRSAADQKVVCNVVMSLRKRRSSMPIMSPSQRPACNDSCRAISRAAASRKEVSSRSPRQPYIHLQVPVYCGGANQTARRNSPSDKGSAAATPTALGVSLMSRASTATRRSPTVAHSKTSCGRSVSPGTATRRLRQSVSTANESTPAKLALAGGALLPSRGPSKASNRRPAVVEATATAPPSSPTAIGSVWSPSLGKSTTSRTVFSHHRLSKSL
mmetsp:Transcript_686/g.1781  ORF Transcript_686/g.1781 Transcript_686/m.1781 type:complete len:265 (-) Transcript_686:159-953(-)